ncbi:hypothetical protein ACFU3O_36450 [Streptomyces antibioticus]|uniref:hypothetical protein n=1 Tax=Streptomyces antibioticus TaxID=1890 RepID=UPI003691031C
MPDWAWITLSASGTVRHQRCGAEWLAFSTTPLHLGRPPSGVDELNTVQICAVRLYVCTRTGSALRPFITRQS